jgi:hypothetical protein
MSGDIETRVALLERDVIQVNSFFAKLDTTMEKLADVSASIKELLSVHELRINHQEEYHAHLSELIENRRIQSESQHQVIGTKIVESEKELRKEMDEFQKTVLNEMKEIRKELRSYHEDAIKSAQHIDKLKLFFTAGATLIVFILYKIGIIPFSFLKI